jgi:hypothetical protein
VALELKKSGALDGLTVEHYPNAIYRYS